MSEPGNWGLDRLLAAFPTLCPQPGGVPARPVLTVPGHGHFQDDERPGDRAEVDLTIAPAADIVIRVPGWPTGLIRRDILEPALVKGVVKAALNMVKPFPFACATTVTAIRCAPDAGERAVQVAAYRAFEQAALAAVWDLAAPFPEIAPTPDEDLDAALARITGAFESAGFSVDRTADRALTEAQRLSLRAFYIDLWIEKGGKSVSHIFFVCPYLWLPEQEADFTAARSSLMRIQYNDFLQVPQVHVLSAWPELTPP